MFAFNIFFFKKVLIIFEEAPKICLILVWGALLPLALFVSIQYLFRSFFTWFVFMDLVFIGSSQNQV